MQQLKKNTWLIYYCLVVISTGLLLSSVYNKYDELLTIQKNEQLYITKIVKSDIDTIFSSYDSIVDMVRADFSKDSTLNQTYLENILNKSELLSGFMLFNPDGTIKAKSNNIPFDSRHDDLSYYFKYLTKNPSNERLFIDKALHSPFTKKWIIPLQKRLFDKKNNFVGHISTAIEYEKLKNKWLLSKTFDNQVVLYAEETLYPFLNTTINEEDYEKHFNQPLSNSYFLQLEAELKKKGLSIEKLKATGEVAQITLSINDKKILQSIVYHKEYKFWTQASKEFHYITAPLLSVVGYYVMLYFFFVIVIYLLFKRLLTVEQNKFKELTYKSEHDDLTDCYNRSTMKSLSKMLKKRNNYFSLLYIDLDNFKRINDSFGHTYGDKVLQEICLCIQKKLTGIPSYLIRYSGDKFIILLGIKRKEAVESFTINLLKGIETSHVIAHNTLSVTASIGITRYPEDSKHLDSLVTYAENCVSVAKKRKNNYFFFSAELQQELNERIQIEQALHKAIDADEVHLVYQPQVDQDGTLMGVEALARWKSSILGEVSPNIFIPIAEESRFMPKLGKYIMDKAIAEISQLQDSTGNQFSLSINISAKQLMQSNCFELIMQSIQDFGSKKLPITIEITESLFIENINLLIPIFVKMKENNISFALDDFGTGYSSLSMLREMPIDELKIDKSFIDHISNNDKDEAMVKSIINMAKNLNIRVLAEGVETKEHVDILKESGCDLYQGYYFSKGLSIEELKQFVLNK